MLAMFETIAMAGFAAAYWSCGPRFLKRHGAYIGWTAFGLAFLTKGPPALLPLLAFMLYHFIYGKNKLRTLKPGLGVALFLVFGGSWYLYVIAKEASLFDYFIRNEIFGRIFTEQHQRNNQWYGAFAIYVPHIAIRHLALVLFCLWGSYQYNIRKTADREKRKFMLPR